MTGTNMDRPWDWYDGKIPANASIHESAYLETAFSFLLFRGTRPAAVVMERAASAYLGTMFDVGPSGSVSIGEYSLVHGAWFVSDARIEIGSHCLVSWNVMLMDTYRWSRDSDRRRRVLQQTPVRLHHRGEDEPGSPIRIGSNVWIGFDCCVLPGVTIGDGAVVGARSVITDDLPPYCVAVGNPARVVRYVEPHRSGIGE